MRVTTTVTTEFTVRLDMLSDLAHTARARKGFTPKAEHFLEIADYIRMNNIPKDARVSNSGCGTFTITYSR